MNRIIRKCAAFPVYKSPITNWQRMIAADKQMDALKEQYPEVKEVGLEIQRNFLSLYLWIFGPIVIVSLILLIIDFL